MKNLALVLICVALLGAASPASKNVTITVNGEATISQAPDSASIGLSIMTAAVVAQTATSDNNSRYNDLRNRLRAIGIADDAIRTLSFNVSDYNAPQPVPMERPQNWMRPVPYPGAPGAGFMVIRQVEIRLKNLELVGKAVDQAVAANVSDVYNVAYSISNYRTLYAQALKSAVADAQMQARAMASAADMHIVRVTAMQSGGFYPRPMMLRTMSAKAPGGTLIPTEIQQPGALDVHANVTVSYIIAP